MGTQLVVAVLLFVGGVRHRRRPRVRWGRATLRRAPRTSEAADSRRRPPSRPFPTTAAGGPPSVTMSFTGDTLPHSPLWRRANEYTGGTGYDFFPMFADVAPTISRADVATCHLETPIAPAGEEFTTDPLYGVPPQIVSAMAKAGYDRCSTASNHVLDRGVGGVDRTVEVLLENGMGQAGMARDELESLPEVFDVDGVRIGHLSYTYGTNGIPVPTAEPWRTNLIDPVRIIRDANSARDLGADVVVVSMHWGTEKVTEPNEQQLDRRRAAHRQRSDRSARRSPRTRRPADPKDQRRLGRLRASATSCRTSPSTKRGREQSGRRDRRVRDRGRRCRQRQSSRRPPSSRRGSTSGTAG